MTGFFFTILTTKLRIIQHMLSCSCSAVQCSAALFIWVPRPCPTTGWWLASGLAEPGKLPLLLFFSSGAPSRLLAKNALGPFLLFPSYRLSLPLSSPEIPAPPDSQGLSYSLCLLPRWVRCAGLRSLRFGLLPSWAPSTPCSLARAPFPLLWTFGFAWGKARVYGSRWSKFSCLACRVAFGDSGGGEKKLSFSGDSWMKVKKNANLLSVPPRPELNSKIRTWRTCPSSFAGLELDSTVLAAGLVRHFWNRGRVTGIGSS